MSTEKNNSDNIFDMLLGWLQTLPTDIKILFEMVGDNELDMRARSLAVGTIVYILSPLDLIPEKMKKLKVIGYIDDVVVLRIAFALVFEIDPHRATYYYREKYPESFETLEQQIALLKKTLGALYDWLRALVERLRQRRYHGESTEDVANSEQVQEEMFDEAMEYAADVNVDPEVIKQALLAAPPNRIIDLLSSGLEEEQKRQAKAEKGEQSKIQLSDALGKFRKLLAAESKETD